MYYGRRRSPSGAKIFLAVSLMLVVLLGPAIGCNVYKETETTVTFTVDDKERVTGDTSKYLVFTKGEVLEVSDALAYLRFNSSDLYGRLTVGKTYRGRVVGWRVPFLSWYRNILTATEVG